MTNTLHKELKVVSKKTILIEGLEGKEAYFSGQLDDFFSLYLLSDPSANKYYVYTPTEYSYDDSPVGLLGPYDTIDYAYCSAFKREFEELTEAQKFFNKVVVMLSDPFSLDSITDSFEIYSFNPKASISMGPFNKRIPFVEKFEKKIVSHGYQSIFFKSFRIDNEININKHFKLVFEDIETAKTNFKKINDFFYNFIGFEIPYVGDEMKITETLDMLLSDCADLEAKELNFKKDYLGRYLDINLAVKNKKGSLSLKFRLTSRNGYYNNSEIDARLFFSEKGKDATYYKEFTKKDYFLEELDKCLAQFFG